MTQEFKDLLFLFSQGARGKQISLKNKYNTTEILRIAKLHGVWAMVCYALNDINQDVLKMGMIKAKKQYLIYSYMKKLSDNGIEVAFIKGEILDDLYFDPSIRHTGDTDVLIDKKDEKKTLKILKENGFIILERAAISNEQKCVHPDAGLLEVHFGLDNKQMSEIWFDNKTNDLEPFRVHISKANISYLTLSETDGLINVFLHFVKHFITGVATIKMLMDIFMYIEFYNEKINWEKFNSLMKYLKYDKLFEIVKFIGTKYFEFDFETQDYFIQAEKVLTDIENSRYTDAQMESTLYEIYAKERYNRFNSGKYSEYKKKMKLIDFKKSYFPSVITLSGKFPFLSKYPYLLPFIWCYKFYKSILRSIDRKPIDSKITENKNNRMELIKDLDII
jgi:hypothetical protein